VGGAATRPPISAISSGNTAIDVALGIGGFPRGRIVEIYGPESSGKTTVALHAIASAQREGGIAAFIDAEHALDPEYARKLGVDTDALLVSQPDHGEQALEIADMLIRSGAIDLIVVDPDGGQASRVGGEDLGVGRVRAAGVGPHPQAVAVDRGVIGRPHPGPVRAPEPEINLDNAHRNLPSQTF